MDIGAIQVEVVTLVIAGAVLGKLFIQDLINQVKK
jgi:hypothetical protein